MYYVLGGDGRQYGPFDVVMLSEWLDEGRIDATTLSFEPGETRWIPLRARPSLADVLTAHAATCRARYYVLGSDGQQYGPFDEAMLSGWLDDGRIDATTLSFETGETRWIPLRERPGLANVLAIHSAPCPATYYVLGSDNQQYGPVDEATLCAWLGEGRVYATALSFVPGETTWTPLRDRPAFANVSAVHSAPGPISKKHGSDALLSVLDAGLSISSGVLAIAMGAIPTVSLDPPDRKR